MNITVLNTFSATTKCCTDALLTIYGAFIYMTYSSVKMVQYRNIYKFITVLEIFRDLPLFGYSSLGNSSTMENLSSPNLSTQN